MNSNHSPLSASDAPATQADYASDAARWAALVARDDAASQAFFYAVRTTGIFCRPGCVSRLPRRENVTFFDDAEQALNAGYRPCKRCRPTSVPRDVEMVQRACAVLARHPEQRMTLGQLSAQVHLSPFHLQRLFKRVLGVSPRAYQAGLRVATLKNALSAGDSVTVATHAAGFGSTSRMYHAVRDTLGMSPAAYRKGAAGLVIEYASCETPLGTCLIAATDKGVCALALGDDSETLLAQLHAQFNHAQLLPDQGRLGAWLEQITAYLGGQRRFLQMPLDVQATAFQQQVWQQLQQVPYGTTLSYTELAQALGAPNKVRAVASACARNPVALLIPCHRIVQKSGALAGYRWGLARKAALLDRERRSEPEARLARPQARSDRE